MENKIYFLVNPFLYISDLGGKGSMYCLHNQEILGMTAHAQNLSTWGLRQEDCKSKASLQYKKSSRLHREFEASMAYIVKLFLK